MTSLPSSKSLDIPAEYALLAFDMEKYSRIPEAKMESARSEVDDLLTNVLADCALPDPEVVPDTYKDTGDGAILLFPPAVLARLVDPFLGRLSAALLRHEQHRLASNPVVRLRVSVHAGPVPPRRLRGGNALIDANRLLNSQAVRQALEAAKATDTLVAGVLSETAYRRCVHGGYTPQLTPVHFLQATARVSDKPDFEAPCHLHVPGMTGAAIAPYVTDEPDSDSSAAGVLPESSPPGAGPSSAAAAPDSGGAIQFHAPVYGATVGSHIGQVHNTYPLR
jgi:hypothetical protein